MPTVIAFLFFVSGLVALLYEIVWVRGIGYVLGASSSAIAMVVAAYLTGLAFGAWWAGRRGWGVRRGLATYAILEVCIAATAPWAVQVLGLADRVVLDPLWPWLSSHGLLHLARFVTTLAVLFVPTALMGATLPVLCTTLRRTLARPGAVVGWLYGLNTLGGVVGCLVAGFWTVEHLGLSSSLFVCAVLNLTLAASAIWVGRRWTAAVAALPQPQEEATPGLDATGAPPPRALILAAVAVSSFVSIGMEILWARLVALAVGGSTYAFSLVLAVFLFGLGAGSLALGFIARRRPVGALLFGAVQVAVGLLVLATVGFHDEIVGWVGLNLHDARGSFLSRAGWSLCLCLLLCALPAFLMGFSFPLLSEMWIRRLDEIGRGVGVVYVVSTAGGVAGSAGTTFFLMGSLGLEATLVTLAFMSVCLGAVFLPFHRARPVLATAIGAAALLGALSMFLGERSPLAWPRRAEWDTVPVYLGVSLYGEEVLDGRRETLFLQDGPASSVAVFGHGEGRELAVNGKVDASSSGDMATQLWLAYLPQLLHPDPRDAFVLGYGSGVTAGAAARFGSRVVCAEIEQGVIDASKFFEEVNFGAHANPQIQLHAADGRAMLRRGDEDYDVITTEPSNPWMAGMASLFTKEFYQLCASRLREGGLLCQWVHVYWMAPEDYRAIVATVRSVFPSVAVFRTQPADKGLARLAGDTLLIASMDDIGFDLEALGRRLGDKPQVRTDLREASALWLGFPDARGWDLAYLAALLVAGPAAVDEYVKADTRQIRDDLPFLEFSAARQMHQSHSAQIFAELLAARSDLNRSSARDWWAPWRGASPWSEVQQAWLSFYRGAELLTYGRVEEATVELERAASIDPSLSGLLLPRWICAYRMQDSVAEPVLFQEMVEGRPRLLFRAADEFARDGEIQRARDALETYRRRVRADAEWETAVGELMRREGNLTEAARAFERALRKDPNHERARSLLLELQSDAE